MAESFEDAFAKIAGPRFDRIVYSAKPIHRAPPDGRFSKAFSRIDRRRLRQAHDQVVQRRGCCLADAEEAVSEELTVLMERRPEIFEMPLERWWKILLSRASFRVLGGSGAPPARSTEAIEGSGGDGTIAAAGSCVPISASAEEGAGSPPPSKPGDRWSRRQVISALRRFHRYYGRPPRVADCRVTNRLPSYGTIRRHFDRFDEALLAAGIVPSEIGRRRRHWPALEAARACRAFYLEAGYWPSAGDARRHPDVLPGRSVMLRCFGSTHGGEIRAVAEAILATDPRKARRRRN